MIELSEQEIRDLYVHLKCHEEKLSNRLVPLLTKIERHLYTRMSIEDVEKLSRSGHTGGV